MDEQVQAQVVGAPLADLARSPASRRVGELAARSGLFLFDYEARVQLELPEHWLPIGRPDLGVTGRPPTWSRGALAESKYLSFRHDVLVGSMHAGHRAKWTAHELCHGLVGFCWSPSGSMLFHALAARLAEALPVALWYFFDEANLRRCPRHEAHREVGPGYCAACEVAAAAGARTDDPEAARWIARGEAFLGREIAAVRQAMRTGRPVFTPHGPIDLMSDGLAYAAAHLERLRSPELQGWVARFAADDPGLSGWHPDLESLIDRVEELAHVLTGELPFASPLIGGRWRWVAQDLGQRLLQVAAETDGECFTELDRLVEHLTDPHVGEAQVAAVIEGYDALFEDYDLPDPDEMFAVGYPLPHGRGRSVRQIREGLETACPAALRAVGDIDEAVVAAFVARGAPERRPLGHRFAAFLEQRFPGSEVAAVARLEAAIAHAPPADAIELSLGWDGARPLTVGLASGVSLVRAPADVAGMVLGGADRAAAGAHSWLVRRDAAEEVGITAVSEPCADLVARLPLPEPEIAVDREIAALIEEGFLVPDAWGLDV